MVMNGTFYTPAFRPKSIIIFDLLMSATVWRPNMTRKIMFGLREKLNIINGEMLHVSPAEFQIHWSVSQLKSYPTPMHAETALLISS